MQNNNINTATDIDVGGKDEGVRDLLARCYCSCTEGERSNYEKHSQSCDYIQGCYVDFQVLTNQLTTLINSVRDDGQQKIRYCLYMYTHQWSGDDKHRLCENCGEVVEKWTVCESSDLKSSELAKDILEALKQKDEGMG